MLLGFDAKRTRARVHPDGTGSEDLVTVVFKYTLCDISYQSLMNGMPRAYQSRSEVLLDVVGIVQHALRALTTSSESFLSMRENHDVGKQEEKNN